MPNEDSGDSPTHLRWSLTSDQERAAGTMSETKAKDPVATVKQWFQFAHEEDFAALGKLVHDDLVARLSEELPYGGEFHGMPGLIEARKGVMSVIEPHGPPTDFQIHQTVDGHVVVKLGGSWVARNTGKSTYGDVMEFFRFRDGKIAEVDIFYREPGAVAAIVA